MVDRDELRALYERRFHQYLAGAYAVVGEVELARDVVQESFARALHRRRSFRGEAPLEAWLWRIVINTACDTARKTRRQAATAEQLASLAAPDSSAPDLERLVAELRELPDRQRLAVFLHYYADLSYDEVARALDVAPGTVAASLHAARAALRRRLEEAL